MARVYQRRGTRAALDALAGSSDLTAGEIYLVTDENRIVVGLSATTYSSLALLVETSRMDLDGGYSEASVVVASAGSAETVSLDGRLYDLTLDAANCAITISVPSGVTVGSAVVLLRQDATGGRAVSWLGSPKVMGAQSDNTGASTISQWVVSTPDGGTTILLTPAGTEV